MNRRPGRRPTRFASSALWTPHQLPNLGIWLRADMGITLTSLAVPSNLASAWSWDAGIASHSASQPDPVGGTSAYLITEDTSTGSHTGYSYPLGTDDGKGDRTITFWAKSNGRAWVHAIMGNISFWVDIVNGTVGTNLHVGGGDVPIITMTNVGGGWWKVVATQKNETLLPYYSQYLRLYLCDADNSISHTGDGTSGVYFYGVSISTAAVSAWADQSGNGYHATQATASKQPPFCAAQSLTGGRPALGKFDAGGANLHLGFSATNVFPAPWTIAIVTYLASAPAQNVYWHGASFRADNYVDPGGTHHFLIDGAATDANYGSGIGLRAHIDIQDSAGGTHAIYNNSNTPYTFAPYGVDQRKFFDGATDRAIGAWTTGAGFNPGGYLAELVLTSSRMSAGDVARLNMYFARRYGVAIT